MWVCVFACVCVCVRVCACVAHLAIQLSDEMIVMLPEQTFQNAPCVLIEQGVFNQLFNNPDMFSLPAGFDDCILYDGRFKSLSIQ